VLMILLLMSRHCADESTVVISAILINSQKMK
jgi:hypothetical protein